jgi:hypothetical protein
VKPAGRPKRVPFFESFLIEKENAFGQIEFTTHPKKTDR